MQQHSDLLEVTFKGSPSVVMAALRDVVGGLSAADLIDRPDMGSVINMVRPSSRPAKTS
jgi:hypothetical protein